MRFVLNTLVFLLFVLSVLKGQTYDFRNYNVEDGLAQSQVLCLYQDAYGAIWMGTNGGGATRYDGHHFYSFSAKDSLKDNVVFSIEGGLNGEILLGTNGGLSVYNGIKMKNYSERDGLTHNRIFKVLKDRNNIVWLCTGKGICVFKNGKIEAFNIDSVLANTPVFTMYQDNGGNMWFGTISEGLFRCKNVKGKWKCEQVSKQNGLPENFVRSFGEDHKGNVLAGTVAGIVIIDQNLKCTPLNLPRQENIAFIAQTRDLKNNVWLGTDNGVFKWSPGTNYSQYTVKNGLNSNVVISILVDREGNVWMGTDGSGVIKLSGEAFVNYSQRDSLPGDYISAAYADAKGAYWLGIKNSGVCKIDNGKITRFRWELKNKNSIADNEVSDIDEDKNGNILLATKEGLSVYNGKTFTNYYQKNGLPSNNVYSLYKEGSDFWVGTKGGAARFDGQNFYPLEAIEKIKGENDFPVFCFERDKDNNLWLGTEYGVYIFTGKELIHQKVTDGISEKRTVSIVKDKKNGIWIGTVEGLFYYDGIKFSHYSESQHIASNKIYLLQKDESDFLWIGTNKGLDRLDLNAFYKNEGFPVKHYGKEDGVKGLECNLNACAIDREGKLLFGTIKGLTVYNPRFDRKNDKEAISRITSIRLSFEKFDFSEYCQGIDSSSSLPKNLVLPYDMNHLTFDFVGVCITNPSKVKYKYKLEGIDPDWIPPTSKNEATYPALPPGKYTFMLRSMNNDGLWNENPVVFKF
jgi:ligand-binding sensor domain-containing protein